MKKICRCGHDSLVHAGLKCHFDGCKCICYTDADIVECDCDECVFGGIENDSLGG